MPFLLLIVEPTGQRRERSLDEGRALYASMVDFSTVLQSRGVLLASQSLKSDAEGVRVQLREGRKSLVDGPFAETKEIVGGYFVLDCATKTEAIAIAVECPAAAWATVEVREFGPCFL